MTKETKIGLLVGLAFIILFAIILSEKGAPQRDAKSPNFATLPNRAPDGTTGLTPLQDGGRIAVENHLNSIVQPSQVAIGNALTEEPIFSADTVDEDSLPPLPESVVASFNNPGAAAPANTIKPPADAAVDAVAINMPRGGIPAHSVTPGPATSSPRGVFNPTLTGPTMTPRIGAPIVGQGGVVGEHGLIATGLEPTAPPVDRSATMIPAVATNDAPTVIRATHTVKDGDCVSKIAAEYYGRSTPDRIKLLENANREVLKQKKGIRAGDKIRIPELAGYEDRFEAVAGFTQPRTSPATPGAPSRDASIVSESADIVSAGDMGRDEPFEIKDGAPRVPKAIPEVKPPAGGLVLVKPPIDEHANASIDGHAGPEPRSRMSKTRWYEVQSGDTLSKIARRELGNERQHKAIYKLNRDVLTNQHALKPGTKLRLPPAEDPALSSSVTTGRTTPGAEQ